MLEHRDHYITSSTTSTYTTTVRDEYPESRPLVSHTSESDEERGPLGGVSSPSDGALLQRGGHKHHHEVYRCMNCGKWVSSVESDVRVRYIWHNHMHMAQSHTYGTITHIWHNHTHMAQSHTG